MYQQIKEPLYVPPPMDNDTGYQRDNDYARGWNACRQVILDEIAAREAGGIHG